MAANLAAAVGVHAERDSLTALVEPAPTVDWTGADAALVTAAVTRAQAWLTASA